MIITKRGLHIDENFKPFKYLLTEEERNKFKSTIEWLEAFDENTRYVIKDFKAKDEVTVHFNKYLKILEIIKNRKE